VRTRNGHQLPCDWLDGIDSENTSTPIVIIIPGITGHSRSNYLCHLVKAINKTGKRVVVMPHPGMGDLQTITSPRLAVTYETTDLQDRIDAIHALYPNAHLQCFAYSLGACMLINYLGTVGENTPLASAVTVSNPFDILAVANYLQSYFLGRHLIDRHFTSVYRDTFIRNKELFVNAYQDKIDILGLEHAVSVFEFDEHFSRRAYGFSTLEEYYYVSSCIRNLSLVQIPMLVIHAADDPIAPLSVVPIDRLKSNPNIITAITEHGGHSGWLEGLIPWNRPAWVDRVACEWIDTILKHQVGEGKEKMNPTLIQKVEAKSNTSTERKRRYSGRK
jgi:abhydrolase domain-containing protein 1/3